MSISLLYNPFEIFAFFVFIRRPALKGLTLSGLKYTIVIFIHYLLVLFPAQFYIYHNFTAGMRQWFSIAMYTSSYIIIHYLHK